MSEFKTGKKPAREGAYKFKLNSYVALGALPTAPAVFGYTIYSRDLGMLGNDQYGDCVFAGADHEHMLWARGDAPSFSEQTALSDYSAVTGFNPADPSTDQGTDMEDAAKYRRKIGIVDESGLRHLIGAYVAIPGVSAHGENDPTFLNTLANAAYAFEAVGIGIEFPSTAMDQFNNGQPWDVVKGSHIEGGHYVPLVGRRKNGNFVVVTWGAFQEVTPAFLLKYTDEAIVYLTTEFLGADGLTREGFDLAALNADLAALGGTPIPAPTPVPIPIPSPVAETPPFPLDQVQPWLDAKCFTSKGKAAQKAIRAWLAAGGE